MNKITYALGAIIPAITICVIVVFNISKIESSDNNPSTNHQTPITHENSANNNPSSSSNLSESIAELQLTEEEIEAKPDDIDEINWLTTVFFHRANVQGGCKDSSVKVRTRHWSAALAADGA